MFVFRSVKIVSADAKKGVGALVANVALPSALFLGVSNLSAGDLDGRIIGVICMGKIVVFAVGFAAAVARDRSWNGIKTGGIFALATSNSNDLAFGLPIVNAIYPKLPTDKVNVASYLYVATAVQVATLNFVGFLLMDIATRRIEGKGKPAQVSTRRILLKVFLATLTNKIVLMCLLGLIYNASFGTPPTYINSLFTTMGNAFPCGALFLLGMSLNSSFTIKGRDLIWPVFLVFVKVIMMPMVLRIFTSLFGTLKTDDADFIFIYGTLPAPPAVFIWATEYGAMVETISATVVLGTLVFSPVSFATTVLISSRNKEALLTALSGLRVGANIASIVGCALVICAVALVPRLRKYPFNLITMFALLRLSSSLMRLAVCRSDSHAQEMLDKRSFMLVANHVVQLTERFLTMSIAINLVLIARFGRARAKAFHPWIHAAVWGLSITAAMTMYFLFKPKTVQNALTRCLYVYGEPQYVFDALVFSLSLVIFSCSIGAIEVLHGRKRVSRDLTEEASWASPLGRVGLLASSHEGDHGSHEASKDKEGTKGVGKDDDPWRGRGSKRDDRGHGSTLAGDLHHGESSRERVHAPGNGGRSHDPHSLKEPLLYQGYQGDDNDLSLSPSLHGRGSYATMPLPLTKRETERERSPYITTSLFPSQSAIKDAEKVSIIISL